MPVQRPYQMLYSGIPFVFKDFLLRQAVANSGRNSHEVNPSDKEENATTLCA